MGEFYRVYIVKAVRNMQLMCSCKFFERHGLPCRHLLRIIGEPRLTSCSVRWWNRYEYFYLRDDEITKYLSSMKDNELCGPLFEEDSEPECYPILYGTSIAYFKLDSTFKVVEEMSMSTLSNNNYAECLGKNTDPTKFVTCIDTKASNELETEFDMYDGFEVLTEQSEMLASIQVDSSLPDFASIYSKCLPIFKEITTLTKSEEEEELVESLHDLRDKFLKRRTSELSQSSTNVASCNVPLNKKRKSKRFLSGGVY